MALLVYLAAAPAPGTLHRRDSLLALFWPESDARHARMSLRKALQMLRRDLGPGVLLGKRREAVGVDPGRLRCDVAGFEEALMAGDARAALERYAGDFLVGFHVSGAPGFERWMEGRERELRQAATAAAWRLSAEREAAGSPQEALRWARWALASAPYEESGLRRLLELHLRRGDRAAVVRASERFAERLRADLELEPSASLRKWVGEATAEPLEGDVPESRSTTVARGTHVRPSTVGRTSPSTSGVGVRTPSTTVPERGRVFPRAAAALLVFAALGYGATALIDSGEEPRRVPDDRSVAILPFEDLSEDRAQPFFAAAMTEEMASAFSEVPDLTVKSRNSASRYSESQMSVAEFAREIGVAHVVEGSVQRSGDRVRITVQLVDARSDDHVWSETYDRRLPDLFDVQVEVARQVANRLAASFTEREQQRILAGATEDPVAYDLYLRADARVIDLDDRIELLGRAVASDSTFWPAWERMAYLYRDKERRGEGTQWSDSGHAALRRALATAEHPSARLRMQAWESLLFEGEDEESIARLAAAAAERPSDLALAQTLGNVLSLRGRLDEAARWKRHAALLNPLEPWSWLALFQTYMHVGLYEEAEGTLGRALAADPALPATWNGFGWLRLMQGRFDEAVAAFDSAEALGESHSALGRGSVRWWAGDFERARDEFDAFDLSKMSRASQTLLLSMAHARQALGDSTGARRIIERVRRLLESQVTENALPGRIRPRLQLAAIENDTLQAIRLFEAYVERGGRDYYSYAQSPLFADLREVPAFNTRLKDLGLMVAESRRQILLLDQMEP